jgi:selenocysteine lyase/cysteine desulfurase
MTTRRLFLGGLTGAAAGLYVPSASASPRKLMPILASVPMNSENYWKLVSEQFPLRSGKIMMNAANLCPASRSVADRVTELSRDIDADVSSQNRAKFVELQEESRTKVAEQINASADEIALVRNTSEANNAVSGGFALKAGDEVVLWDQNHECNNQAWNVKAARYGFSVKRVSVPSTVKDAAEIVKLFDAALTPQTKLLSITYVSNTSGTRLPAKDLCALAHSKGIYCHLDGAQAWGVLKIDVKDIGCDSFSGSAHKWLAGPKQVGLLYVREERIQPMWANIIAIGWGKKIEPEVKGARKFEMLGQRDDAALAAMSTAVDFQHILGFENVEGRTLELAGALQAGLAKIDKLKPLTPQDPKLRGGVINSSIPSGIDRKALVNELYSKYGVAGAATGGLRLSPHIYNTMDDVEKTIYAVRQLMA